MSRYLKELEVIVVDPSRHRRKVHVMQIRHEETMNFKRGLIDYNNVH